MMRPILAFILCITLIIETQCQIDIKQSNENFKIIGGELANITAFPYQVSLQVISNGRFFHICGGSIIDAAHVLTAAHCVYTSSNKLMNVDDLVVLAGTNDVQNINTTGQMRKVRKIVAHSKYSTKAASWEYDIALIKLAQNFTSTIALRSIAMRTGISPTGENCTVSGWGKLSLNGDLSRYLMKVNVPIFNHLTCRQNYGNIVTDSMICAGLVLGGKDSCQGDSGGPLVCGGQLAGIVSFGKDCALMNYPGVYTEVAKYIDWVKAAVSGASNHFQEKYFTILLLICLCTLMHK